MIFDSSLTGLMLLPFALNNITHLQGSYTLWTVILIIL